MTYYSPLIKLINYFFISILKANRKDKWAGILFWYSLKANRKDKWAGILFGILLCHEVSNLRLKFKV